MDNQTEEARIEECGTSSEIGTVAAHLDDGSPSFVTTIAPDLRALAFPIAGLRAAPDNARQHGERDLTALAESLKRGQQKPVVAKRTYRGLSNVVIAGCGTLMAARRLGWSHVAVSWFEGTDDEARQYAIRDNRTAELSRWDTDALATLQGDGGDLLSLGWNAVELADLFAASASVPKFQPEAPAHRLDELADNTTCPNCGHRFHREGR